MSQNQLFNGTVYSIPTQGDLRWASPLDRYLVALGTYALAPSGGTFTLTANVNFGATFGLLSAYFSGRGTVADAGLLRLSKTDVIDWRNNGGSGNNVLGVDSSDNLTYNGVAVPTGLSTLTDGKIWIGSVANLPVAQTLTGDITVTNAGVTAIGAGKLVNAQVNNAAAIAYSKLNLTGSILNSDIFSSAAIDYSKLAALTASRAVVTDASGFLTPATTTSTEIGYVNGVTSAIQTQLNAKQASGNYITALTGDVTASGPGSVASTLATVNSNVGSFTAANITVNAKGLITAAANGASGGTVTSVSGTANQIAVATGTSTPVISITSPLTLPGAVTAGGAIAMAANKITGLANGTVSTDAAAFGQIPTAGILKQVIFAHGTTTTATTSTSYVDTVITASITPTASSSKILVTMVTAVRTATGNIGEGLTSIFRGGVAGTNLAGSGVDMIFPQANTGVAFAMPLTLQWLDSPATTSSTTYTLGLRTDNAGTSVSVNASSLGTWTVILQEISQ